MLSVYRRHRRHCPHRHKGRIHLRCGCPLWVDGRLNGKRFHKALGTSDWQKAQRIARNLETNGPQFESEKPREPITLEDGLARFIVHLEARNLRASTIRKYRLLERQLKHFLFAKKV